MHMKIGTEDVIFGIILIAAVYGVYKIGKTIYMTHQEIKKTKELLNK